MKILSILLLGSTLIGCATPTVVQKNELDDNQLSCFEIKKEIIEAEGFEDAARKERTVTGTNVAAAVLFWPALIGTYVNTDKAIDAAQDRRDVLVARYLELSCYQ